MGTIILHDRPGNVNGLSGTVSPDTSRVGTGHLVDLQAYTVA